MSGKSMDYWRSAWTRAKSRSEDNIDAGKVLNLLSQYSAFYKRLPIIRLPVAWGGCIGRFFSGRWNTHHGSEVQSAIENFFHMDGYYAHTPRFHTVEFILARVKQKIGNKQMNPNGDLARILNVVKEQTGVDYTNLDAESILDSYEQSRHTNSSMQG